MDLGTIIGLALGVGIILFGTREGGGVGVFLNAHGIIIVVGGTFAAMLINSTISTIGNTIRALLGLVFSRRPPSLRATIDLVRKLAEINRSDGLLALEGPGENFGDGFLERSVNMAITSGGNADFVRDVMEQEILQIRQRHLRVTDLLRSLAMISPMFGLVGTLIGIVHVLQQITDPEKVGPAMAVALSTAFYGILLSALVGTPLANKLRERSQDETVLKQIILEGMMGICRGEQPSLLEIRLRAFASRKGATPAALGPSASVNQAA